MSQISLSTNNTHLLTYYIHDTTMKLVLFSFKFNKSVKYWQIWTKSKKSNCALLECVCILWGYVSKLFCDWKKSCFLQLCYSVNGLSGLLITLQLQNGWVVEEVIMWINNLVSIEKVLVMVNSQTYWITQVKCVAY